VAATTTRRTKGEAHGVNTTSADCLFVAHGRLEGHAGAPDEDEVVADGVRHEVLREREVGLLEGEARSGGGSDTTHHDGRVCAGRRHKRA
jgi:hypothetical protein